MSDLFSNQFLSTIGNKLRPYLDQISSNADSPISPTPQNKQPLPPSPGYYSYPLKSTDSLLNPKNKQFDPWHFSSDYMSKPRDLRNEKFINLEENPFYVNPEASKNVILPRLRNNGNPNTENTQQSNQNVNTQSKSDWWDSLIGGIKSGFEYTSPFFKGLAHIAHNAAAAGAGSSYSDAERQWLQTTEFDNPGSDTTLKYREGFKNLYNRINPMTGQPESFLSPDQIDKMTASDLIEFDKRLTNQQKMKLDYDQILSHNQLAKAQMANAYAIAKMQTDTEKEIANIKSQNLNPTLIKNYQGYTTEEVKQNKLMQNINTIFDKYVVNKNGADTIDQTTWLASKTPGIKNMSSKAAELNTLMMDMFAPEFHELYGSALTAQELDIMRTGKGLQAINPEIFVNILKKIRNYAKSNEWAKKYNLNKAKEYYSNPEGSRNFKVLNKKTGQFDVFIDGQRVNNTE